VTDTVCCLAFNVYVPPVLLGYVSSRRRKGRAGCQEKGGPSLAKGSLSPDRTPIPFVCFLARVGHRRQREREVDDLGANVVY